LNSRRQLLFVAAAAVLLPGRVIAAAGSQSAAQQDKAYTSAIGWSEFLARMTALADAHANLKVGQQAVVADGLRYLQQLDIGMAGFEQAVDSAFESGNRYWLWQRMIKQQNINGGILNINSEQLVQLHDHPGATGLLRIISGEVEVWQFDESADNDADSPPGVSELTRVSRNILRAGDMGVLTPDKGNIHALRSISEECRMLDIFIPPYEVSQRNWYQPESKNWFDKEKILCRRIPQHSYMDA